MSQPFFVGLFSSVVSCAYFAVPIVVIVCFHNSVILATLVVSLCYEREKHVQQTKALSLFGPLSRILTSRASAS